MCLLINAECFNLTNRSKFSPNNDFIVKANARL
ncbi:hypothetical protein HPPN135_04690 [Helicobacter pylori Puno135]|nr:hypothetical protein HPPN135_04690 [Helicobacter pylori Puno135]